MDRKLIYYCGVDKNELISKYHFTSISITYLTLSGCELERTTIGFLIRPASINVKQEGKF